MGNDLNILPTQLGVTTLNFDNSGGTFATGPALVAQRFATFLLAQVGSVLHTLDFGTDFVYDARTGVLRNESELNLEFSAAVDDMSDYQKAVVLETDPDGETPLNELFDTAELNEFEYAGERIILNVTVFTQAGTAVDIQVPIAVVEL